MPSFRLDTEIRGLVFDFDGTLVDSLTVTFDAFNAGLVSQGSKPLTPSELLSHFGAGERAIFAKLVGTDRADEAYRVSLEHTRCKQESLPLHDGIAELLEELQRKNVPMAIFTGRGRETTNLILGHHRLHPMFRSVVTHDDVKDSKPNPEGLLLAAKTMGLPVRQCLMIGDSWADLQAAHSAETLSAAALWDSYVELSRIEAERPQWLLRHPRQVLDILR